jgi:O-acetylserine/cysteine efflux transporter
VLALLYVVVISSLVGFGGWSVLLARHPASSVAPFTLLVPVVGIAAAWIALGEVPSGAELIGAAVVLSGLALTVGLTAPRRSRKAPAPCAGSPSPSPQPARP